jgi:Beta-lactamase class C and other penicillin binding proteins
MMKSNIIVLTFLLGISLTLSAQSFDRQKADSLFSIIEKNERGMGSISIFHEGKEVYQNNYGYTNIGNKVKNNSSTKFRIGSISKTFTATIIMTLIEKNELSLSAKLSDFYPQIKNADKITIAHLLQHRSGIANFTGVADYMQWNTEKHTKEQIISRMVSGGISFEPNEKFEYSNSNYLLLTFIAEDVSGKEFSELLQEIISKPCHLKNTFVGEQIHVDNNEALSYTRLTEWTLEKETDMSVPLGAGCIVSTPFDLNTFLNCLFEGKLVKEETLHQMTTLIDGFGLGLIQVPFYDMKGYGHTGGIDGFQANAFYFPKQKVSIALTSNGVFYPLNDIIIGALSIYFGKEYQLPQFKESLTLTTEELDKYLGTYSTNAFPLKLTISRNGNILIAQGTGQPSFPLECTEKNKFKFDQARLELEFIPAENTMILKQNGMTFEMKRE